MSVQVGKAMGVEVRLSDGTRRFLSQFEAQRLAELLIDTLADMDVYALPAATAMKSDGIVQRLLDNMELSASLPPDLRKAMKELAELIRAQDESVPF